MRVRFKKFISSIESWDTLFERAAEFASALPTDRLITISHSADQYEGVVAIWYWWEEDREPPPNADEQESP